jgi:phosphopantetheine adenylyltransferase
MLKESGVAGADRVKSRQDFKQFLASYQHVLSKFPGFVSMTPSGSYNSNPNKQDFGDIDLVVHIQSDQDKATVKKELQAFFTKMPETVIVPFSSAKHAGKRTYNAGELVSVRYHDDALGYSAQVDNIVALDAAEASFKQSFLDMPAEEQGLILGLTKIATIETNPNILFQKLGIKIKEALAQDQEYEFNLSGVELQLRKVTYEPGTFKQLDREILWNSKNFDDVQKLLFQYDLRAGFDDLLQQCKRNIRNPRSGERMKGVFASMISVKSGEVGTAKGAGKEAALAKIQQTFNENRSIFRSLMENNNKKIVFAFGRFQPPTIGHELLITNVKHMAEQQGANYVIYVSKTQDNKSNPLSVGQKIAYLRKMFPGTNFVACDATVRTPIEAAKALNGKYQELIMVAGSDRVSNFEKLLNDYNGKEYQYAMLQVVSAGERDPDSDEVSGMSGTKMRAAAVAGDLQSFMQGLPGTISEQDAINLMTLIQQGLQKPVKAKKGVAEGEAKYDAEWDEKVKRLGQMAKQGERKTVWDPVKRVYKTVPVNTTKKDSPAKETKDGGSIAASKPGYSGEANYTAQANWRGQNIGEDWETAMTRAVLKLIESQVQ